MYVTGLVVADGTLFIADSSHNRVISVPLDGEGPVDGDDATVVAEEGLNSPRGLAISGDTHYVAGMDGTVWSVPVADSSAEPEVFVTGLSGIRGIAAHGGTLYLGEAGGADEDDRVIAAPLDGGDTSPVADVVGINDLTIAVDPCSGSSCLPVVGSLFGSLG